jgi:hypothetical protein
MPILDVEVVCQSSDAQSASPSWYGFFEESLRGVCFDLG